MKQSYVCRVGLTFVVAVARLGDAAFAPRSTIARCVWRRRFNDPRPSNPRRKSCPVNHKRIRLTRAPPVLYRILESKQQQKATKAHNMTPIGFVGLGIMGEGMAGRLLSQGVAGTDETPLVVWNRTGSKCQALADEFPDKKVLIKSTAREVVEACGITYSMLSTPEVSKIVFEGDDGVLAGVSSGKSIVDCATLAEADMQRMNNAVQAKGG